MEFFYRCGWSGATVEEFTGMLNAYLRRHGDIRIKSDPSNMSPVAHRKELGLAV